MGDRQQFDTFSVAAPVPGSWSLSGAGARDGFRVSRLPAGVAWKTLHSPDRGRPFTTAAIPAAKRDKKTGQLKTHGTTGFEGVSVVIGPWGNEPVEYATVQVSAKALHDGDNVRPMDGQSDLEAALEHFVVPTLEGLGFRGRIEDALVARADAVIDFLEVEAHGRYVAAFADNKSPIRGGRHVMHADQTLAMHFAGGMTRLYDKGQESKGHPEAVGRSRFEFELKRPRLRAMGVDTVGKLSVARLAREARLMFEDCGYDREVAPVAEWVYKIMCTVPTYPLCDVCSGAVDGADTTDFDLEFAEESGSWLRSSYNVHRTGCLEPDRCGEAMPGFGTAAKRGALAHAVLTRIGVDPGTHRNTRRLYDKLFDLAGVSPANVELFDSSPDAEVVFLDLESQTERRRAARQAS